MRIESHNTVPHQLEDTETSHLEEPQKSTLMQQNHQDTNLVNDIKAACIHTSLIPALSMDVWLAFDLRDKGQNSEYD